VMDDESTTNMGLTRDARLEVGFTLAVFVGVEITGVWGMVGFGGIAGEGATLVLEEWSTFGGCGMLFEGSVGGLPRPPRPPRFPRLGIPLPRLVLVRPLNAEPGSPVLPQSLIRGEFGVALFGSVEGGCRFGKGAAIIWWYESRRNKGSCFF